MSFKEPEVRSILGISSEFNLTETDVKHRAASFTNEQALRLGGIRRVSEDAANQILGVDRPQKDVEYHGLAIPYFNIWDSNEIIEFEIRRDKPDYEKNGDGELKEKKKYIKPRTSRNLLYIPPMVKTEWFRDKKKRIFVITEGAFKALALARAASNNFTSDDWSFIPMAISGVDNFKTKTTETLENGERVKVSAGLSEFEKINWNGAKIIKCFDSDADTNPHVKAAGYRFNSFFRGQKKTSVFSLDFPKEFEGILTKGIDDYLGAVESKYDVETAITAFHDLIEQAQKPKKSQALTAQNFELVKNGMGEHPGVYYIEEDGKKVWAFSPLEIVAETQTELGENYGRFLRWTDSKGRIKTWAMPVELVHTDGAELVKYLVSRGLVIGTRRLDHDRLKNYINLSQPEETIICTAKLGWNDEAYVFPDETVGSTDHRVVYQPEYMPAHKFGVKGTLAEWQKNISKYCIGNSRLAFGVSLAFAASLVPVVEAQSGGFHNRGGTSSGKTTVSFVAGSVFGGSDDELGYCQSWKATANGLESVAETHNHALLCLDEIAQIDGRQAADVGYMLANGSGKIRQNKNITARRSLSWQLLFLSTGEISLADKMSEAGLTIKGGQEIRVLDIPSDTGKFGVFDTLHEFPDGRKFSDYLRSAARRFYGSAIREFLRELVEFETENIKSGWCGFLNTFIEKILPKNNKYPSEVYRAAARFALVAFAGETATKFGITKWQTGEAVAASETVFRAWFDNRNGRGGSDVERALSQIKSFIESHGSSRFEMLNSSDESLNLGKIINRAGFRKLNSAGEIDYLFLPETFRKEVCKGFDYKIVCKILSERGFLETDGGKFQKNVRCGEMGLTRVYFIKSNIFGDVLDDTENTSTAGHKNTVQQV